MIIKKINMDTWKRKDMFNHFINDVKCVICLTAKVDVTDLVYSCKTKGYRFYPVYIYLVSKIVNNRDEFKMGYDENGQAGIWDIVSPSYIVFNKDDELFTRLITEYVDDFNQFYFNVLENMETYKDKRGFEVEYDIKNTFDISCLPWIGYNSFDMHIFDSGTYLAPVITWGKFCEENGRLLMPLTLQIHHAVADGFHVARFFEEIQKETEQLSSHIKLENTL